MVVVGGVKNVNEGGMNPFIGKSWQSRLHDGSDSFSATFFR